MNKKKKVVLCICIPILVSWIVISGVFVLDYLVPLIKETIDENSQIVRYLIWISIFGGSLLPILIIWNSEYMSQFNERS